MVNQLMANELMVSGKMVNQLMANELMVSGKMCLYFIIYAQM